MIIGTVRPEESRAYDSHEGYHQFHTEESQEPYGSFCIWFVEPTTHRTQEDDETPLEPGWYWQAGFAGCLPDGEPSGPFAYSQQAHQDADEWSPDYWSPDYDGEFDQ